MDEFNPASDSVTTYVERAQLFMEANNVPDDKQVKLFLSALGGKTYSLLWNLLTPTLPRETTFDEIIAVLKNHFETKVGATVRRRRISFLVMAYIEVVE